jgi:hypothetical protein
MLRASTFLGLSLPLAYLLIKVPVETMATLNRYYAFLFLLDLCTSISTWAPIIWKEGRVVPNLDKFELSGMGKVLPVSVGELHSLMNKMLLSILQVVDRVAETQLPSRTVAKEYVAFIMPKKAMLLKKVTATIRMPKTGNRFPDCVGQSWKPCPPQLEGPMLKQRGEQRPTVATTLLPRKEDGALPRIP